MSSHVCRRELQAIIHMTEHTVIKNAVIDLITVNSVRPPRKYSDKVSIQYKPELLYTVYLRSGRVIEGYLYGDDNTVSVAHEINMTLLVRDQIITIQGRLSERLLNG
jgi:hypothetical protein